MNQNAYRTLSQEASDLFIEQKSKFIGHAAPVKTEQEALDFIAKIKAKHWDATHNVHAYVLRENNIQRYTDDGEPKGTAGIPALDVLLKEGITDAVVVVTRYFGGKLLGAGGLVRAYSHGSKIGIVAARPVLMTLCRDFEICCDYGQYDKLLHFLSGQDVMILNTVFAADVAVLIRMQDCTAQNFKSALTEFSGGKLQMTEQNSSFCAWETKVSIQKEADKS